jgi:hypothetical protein
LAAAAMATLYSWRYERNIFAEGWGKLSGLFQKQAQQMAQSVGGTTSPSIYQCNVKGKVLYSNVACDVKSVNTKKVDVQDTHGFEPPKVPVETASIESSRPTLQDKMIEKALQSK